MSPEERLDIPNYAAKDILVELMKHMEVVENEEEDSSLIAEVENWLRDNPDKQNNE